MSENVSKAPRRSKGTTPRWLDVGRFSGVVVAAILGGVLATVVGGIAVFFLTNTFGAAANNKGGQSVPTFGAGVGSKSCGVDGGITVDRGGWGPARPAITFPKAADSPVFDSIVNNKYYGDERTFFDVKNDAITDNGHFCDQLQVSDGELLLLRIYVENSAADGLAGENDQGPGVAHGSTLRIYEDPSPSSLRVVTAELSAVNASPKAVWDTIVLAGSKPFRLDLVGMITVYSSAHPQGYNVSSAAFDGAGTLIGAKGPNGDVAPRYSDAMFVTATVRVTYLG